MSPFGEDGKWVERPVTVDGKPVLYFDPNDYCGAEPGECNTCGGRPWVSEEGHELAIGMEVGIAWYHEAKPDPERILWTRIAGRDDEGGWYVDL